MQETNLLLLLIALQSQQPLQPNNSLVPTNKQNEKVQPELLKKFRQLRQWQQHQQESMFRQQQEQMETLKMQQDKLQTLYQKAVSTGGSPSTTSNGLGDCQRISQQSSVDYINAKTMNERKRNPATMPSMEAFFRTLKTQDKLESSVVTPSLHVQNQDVFYGQQGSPNGNAINTSPVLMTPMQFMSPTSYSRPQTRGPEDLSWSGSTHTSMQQTVVSYLHLMSQQTRSFIGLFARLGYSWDIIVTLALEFSMKENLNNS
jgi:hypothetical protein